MQLMSRPMMPYAGADRGHKLTAEMKVLKRWPIFESAEELNFPDLMRFGNGQLLVQACRGTHCTRMERSIFLVSSDLGETWKEVSAPMRGDALALSGLSMFEQGSQILAYEGRWSCRGRPLIGYRWARDAASTVWKNQAEVEQDGDSFYVPAPWGDERQVQYVVPDDYQGFVLHQPPMAMPDGRLVAMVFGDKKNAPVSSQQKELKFSNVFAIESTDGGLTWRECGRVTDFDSPPPDSQIGYEGPCEPGPIHLGNGHILVAMRTGNVNFESQGRQGMMHWSISHDAGRTWSPVKSLGVPGVLPKFCRLADGRLFLSYGRPGNRLARFDPETGRLGEPSDIFCGDPKFYFESCCNPSCVEVAPNRLLYTYSHSKLCGNGTVGATVNRLMAALIQV